MSVRELKKRVEIRLEEENEHLQEKMVVEYYLLAKEWEEHEELGKIVTYGVEIKKSIGDVFSESDSISDFSSNRSETIALIEKLAANSVTPVTLRDVIEDMLGA